MVQPSSGGDLADTVRGCLARLAPALEEAGMSVSVSLEPHLPEVTYDADAICQILHNLLDNAEVHSRSAARRQVTVTLGREGRTVVLTVADSGPGISRRLRRRLFRAFYRGGSPSSGYPVGLGLGLSLARSLARAQGGDLVCTGSELGGAAFALSLPAGNDPDPRSAKLDSCGDRERAAGDG